MTEKLVRPASIDGSEDERECREGGKPYGEGGCNIVEKETGTTD